MKVTVLFLLLAVGVASVPSTIACANLSSTESVTVRFAQRDCQGAIVVTVYPADSPCGATRETFPVELNSVTYQVCDARNLVICPIVQLYFRSLGAPQAPPTDPATLTCDAVTIPSVQTNAPIELPGGTSDFALPSKCYNLPVAGSLRYYCGLASVPPAFLVGTNFTSQSTTASNVTTPPPVTPAPDPCANYTAPITVCSPSKLDDTSTWFALRNDTCVCPYNCIDCNGNGIVAPFPGKTLASEHRCVCSSSSHTTDCLGCSSSSGCGSGSVCDTSVYVTGSSKVYQCRPDEVLAPYFSGGGLFVWTVTFADSFTTTGGNATMSCYSSPQGTPLLFTCSFGRCDRGTENNKQKITCLDTTCTPTGFPDNALNNIVRSLKGTSTVLLDPSGRTEMFQQEAPVVVVMNCTSSSCQFPNEGQVRQSTLEIALATAFGVAIVLLLAILILICVWNSRRLKKSYADFGTKRIERTVTWEGIECTLKFFVPGKPFRKNRRVLQVLKPMGGSASPGSMTALMGESGSGKTALLDMLAKRKTFGEMHGTVLVNGKVPGTEWKRITGYVLQDDCFIPTQTAREHLQFVSRLKLPANMSNEDRDARVNRVLEEMHLSHVADSQIGDARRKGLSGGEKKRLAIASELIPDPAILFLDEPTSGLDSVNAFRVMKCLHTLAHERGKTIIFAIHAPDSALYELFSNIILMAKGYLMYSGSRHDLIPAMEKLGGRPCPPQYNPADFAIHVIAEIPEDQLMSKSFYEEKVVRVSAVSDFDHVALRNDDDVEMGLVEHKEAVASVEESDKLGVYSQSWLWQTWYVMQRSFADSWRNPYLLRLQYFLIVAAGLVLGGLFYQMKLDLTGAQNRAGLLFFVNAFLMIITLPSIDTFFAERAVFLREKGAGYYSPSSYFVAKALADLLPLRLFPPILFSIIVYPMTGLRGPITYYFWFMLICILISFCATGMCLLISSLSPNVAVGNLTCIIVMMFMLLFGGLLLNNSTLPPGLAWIKWLSFVNYAFSTMMTNEFVNLTFQVAALNNVYPVAGQYFLVSIFGIETQWFYLYIYLLVIVGAVFYGASGIVLYFVHEKR